MSRCAVTPLLAPRRHDVAVRRDGRVDISARVAAALSLSDGDAVNILSASSPSGSEFYLCKAGASSPVLRYRAVCRRSCRRGGTLRLWCKAIAGLFPSAAWDGGKLLIACGETVTLPPYGLCVTLIIPRAHD